MSRPVSRVELSRLFGVSRAAVTKRCQGTWAAACDRDRVDLDHPLIRAAALKKGIEIGEPAHAPTTSRKKPVPRTPAATVDAEMPPIDVATPTKRRREPEPKPELPAQPENAGTDEDLETLARILRPLVARYGTGRGFRDWLISLKDIETISAKRLDTALKRDLYVPREGMEMHVLGLIKGANHRLLTDTPRTLCRELYSLANSGAPIEEAETATRKIIGKQLESLRDKTSAAIRNGSNRIHGERSEVASESD